MSRIPSALFLIKKITNITHLLSNRDLHLNVRKCTYHRLVIAELRRADMRVRSHRDRHVRACTAPAAHLRWRPRTLKNKMIHFIFIVQRISSDSYRESVAPASHLVSIKCVKLVFCWLAFLFFLHKTCICIRTLLNIFHEYVLQNARYQNTLPKLFTGTEW